MSFIAVAIGGSALVGAFSANKASKAQSASADQANALSREQYQQNREDLEPWRISGDMAVRRLSSLMQPGAAMDQKFGIEDFENDPVTQLSFKYGMDQGTRGINNMAGARGMRDSGATLKALTRFGTDYGGQQAGASRDRFIGDQTNLYNRLAGLAGTGQQATQFGAAMGAQNAQTIGQNLMGAGNARGAAAIGQGNAFSSGLNTISNWYGQNAMLDKIIGANH